MNGAHGFDPRGASIIAAAIGAGLFVSGVVLYVVAGVWSAAEYNANEAAGNVDMGASVGVLWLSWIAISMGAAGALLLLSVLIANATRGLRRRSTGGSETSASGSARGQRMST